jgi:hypothetical protein
MYRFKDVYCIQLTQESEPWRRLVYKVMDFDLKHMR